jgi:hypothetical protein
MGRGPLSRLPPRDVERASSAREVRRAARERHMQASYLLYRHPSRTARCGLTCGFPVLAVALRQRRSGVGARPTVNESTARALGRPCCKASG